MQLEVEHLMKRISRTALASLATLALLTIGGTAHADVYTYTESGSPGLQTYGVGAAPGQVPFNATLTVDTAAGTGSLVGDSGAINIDFTGNFAGFMGGATPMNMYNISIDPASSISLSGHNYVFDAAGGHQPMLEFLGKTINLWAVWNAPGCASCSLLGDTVSNITSSSTGGTAVPEPGVAGLIGLGVLALAFRRRQATRGALQPATA